MLNTIHHPYIIIILVALTNHIKMKFNKHFYNFFLALMICQMTMAQDYYFKDKAPFNAEIPTPEEFLGYEIGKHHTRHDLIVAY